MAWLATQLSRAGASAKAQRRRGLAFATVSLVAAGTTGVAIEAATARLGGTGEILAGALVVALLAGRELHFRAAKLFDALQTGGVAAARRELHHLAGRDPDSLDAAGLRRAGLESLAENFSDGVVAPAFWYLAFGFPGLLIYKTASTADSMVGYRNEKWLHFGAASARLDDALNWVPARVSALLLWLASPHRGKRAAAKTILRDAPRHASPNAGWPEAALAASLGVALAGPRRYGGAWVEDSWMNADGDRAPDDATARSGLALYRRSCGLLFLLVVLFAL